jgi:nicotinic acid mononucleotide adenylyltransferase
LSAEITRRSARPEQLAASAAGRIARFPMPPTDISASAVRAGLAAGQDMRELLPAAVLAYIEARHLYPKTA